MDDEPVAIPSDTTVERALDEYFLRYRWPWFPVVDAGRSASSACSTAAPPTRCPRRAATAAPSPTCSTQAPTRARAPASSSSAPTRRSSRLLANIELRRLGGLAAVDADGRLSGVVTLEQVGRALRNAVGASPLSASRRPGPAPDASSDG